MADIGIACGQRLLVLVRDSNADTVGRLEIRQPVQGQADRVLATLTPKAPVSIDAKLTQPSQSHPGLLEFKPFDVAQADALTALREKLRRDLGRVELALAAGAAAFFGIGRLSGAAAASVQAWASLDIAALIDEPSPGAGQVLLAAELRAAASLALGGQRAFAYRLSVRVMADGFADLLAGFDTEGLTFKTPRLDWPNLSFAGLELPALEQLLDLRVPVPGFLGAAPQVRVQWTDAAHEPRLRLDLVGDCLTVTTTQTGDGVVQLRASGQWNDVLTVTGLGLEITPDHGVMVSGTLEAAAAPAPIAELPEGPWGGEGKAPLVVRLRDATIRLEAQGRHDLRTGAGQLHLSATLAIAALELRATEDPSLVLALGLAYGVDCSFAAGAWTMTSRLDRLDVVEPWPIQLVSRLVETAAGAVEDVLRLLALIPLPRAGSPPSLGPLLQRLIGLVEAVLRWLVRQAGAVGQALAGLAEAVFKLFGQLLALLRDLGEAAIEHVAIEVQLDAKTLALRQILLTPASHAPTSETLKADILGLAFELPADWNPGLLIDLTGAGRAAVVVRAPQAQTKVKLSTDLWLKRDAAPSEAIRDQTETGARPGARLIELTAHGNSADRDLIGLITLEQGRARLFRKISSAASIPVVSTSGQQYAVTLGAGPAVWTDLEFGSALSGEVKLDTAGLKRVLPFFQSDKGERTESTGFLEGLGEYVTIEPNGAAAALEGRSVKLPIAVQLHVAQMETQADLDLRLDLDTFQVTLEGGDEIDILGPSQPRRMLGLEVEILPKNPNRSTGPNAPFPQFKLDFGQGDVRLSLHPDAKARLNYRALASAGRGLQFLVETFAVSRAGLDLSAKVDTAEPVRLGGLDVPFRFDAGALSVHRGQLQSFSIKGHGALPPALVGEAKATIELAMGRNGQNELVVTSGKAELDKAGEPLVCHTTRFAFSINALGLEFVDFAKDGGYQFYFTLTGSAQFNPAPGEFTQGLLKNLSGLKIEFNKAPLTGDGGKLARAISFLIPVEPPKRTNLWDIFELETRGWGFQPQAEEFDGDPAVLLSGQVKFTPNADVVSARFDFQRMAIAAPKQGQVLPRLRFDGLTVGLALGGMASVEGTAYAVDDTLPTIFDPNILPKDVTARGFLGAGKLSVQGWASLSASMGFLELRAPPANEPRHAFFFYVKQRELSTEIPTPIGTLYQREVGFGFGFRYTLAAFSAADQVKSVKDLVKVLDDISAYQGDLDNVRAWRPEPNGARLTLALNSVFTMASGSVGGSPYDPKKEAELPNPVLFDVTAALRSDLTFFLAARAWIAVNYADWHDASSQDAWRRQPSLRGYIYLSVPRKEFLGRLVADPDGHVGAHPPLPDPLRQALKRLRWSSTLYIRPGLYHHEFGWPYELGFDLGEPNGNFHVQCRGGMVLRIEDASILNGLAFKARGHACFGGEAGGRSFGASAEARADFAVDAKLIAYLPLQDRAAALFYGALGLDVSVAFRINVWLSFKIFNRRITLSADFCLSLSITVALELAATPSAIAGRGAASISVSAFGRSLRLGVSFGFNEGVLALARARVERYLALGLTASVPDADSGLAPQPARPLGAAARAADEAVAGAAVRRALSDAPSSLSPPEEAAEGRPRQPAHFWAMLARVPGHSDAFVMTLLPKDQTGARPQQTPDAPGRFFAAPPPENARWSAQSLVAQGLDAPVRLQQLRGDGVYPATLQNGMPFAASPVWDAMLDQKEQVTLRDYASACFIRRASDGGLYEPICRAIMPNDAALPDDPQARAETLNNAARDHLGLGVEDAAAVVIEERRSAIIAELGQDLERIASVVVWPDLQGPVAAPPRAASGMDLRDYGLTFVVTASDLKRLFETQTPEAPPIARFKVASAITDDGGAGEGEVLLFNPPDRMFDVQSPQLSGALSRVLGHGVALDWDLEPAWPTASEPEPSQGLWSDPEFHLKHYRIERVLATATQTLAQFPARRVTTKAGAPMRLQQDDHDPLQLTWRRLRPGAQFVDDLSDLPNDVRNALLGGAGAARDWNNAPALKGEAFIQLIYTVIPVDTASNLGRPSPLIRQIDRPIARTAPLKRATATIRYKTLGALDPEITLGFLDPAFEEASDGGLAQTPRPKGGETYRLKVRRERAGPSGLFGADAVTDARARPAADDFAVVYPELDRVFELSLKGDKPDLWPKETAETRREIPVLDTPAGTFTYVLNPKTGRRAELLKALGVGAKSAADKPIPVRLAVQTGGEAGPWTPVDILLTIGENPPLWCGAETAEDAALRAAKPSPLAMPVDVFEHPVSIAPAPLAFEDVIGEAGRLLLAHPAAGADLQDLLRKDGEGLRLLRDPKRRVATRISWNARPTVTDALSRADFTAGFDVFQVDAHALPSNWADLGDPGQRKALGRLAKPVARVQLGAPSLVRLDPAETPDPSKLEAFYPSQTLRDEAARPTGRAPWFSGADTFARLPEFVVRRSLCLTPDEHLITDLFAGIAPTTIEASVVGWPAEEAARLALAGDVPEGVVVSHDGDKIIFKLAESAPLTAVLKPSQVRRLLRGLVWTGQVDVKPEDARQKLRDVRLAVSAKRAGRALAAVEFPTELAPALHPVLADTLDILRYVGKTEGPGAEGFGLGAESQTAWRRYEPVLEAPPPVQAKSVSAWFNEAPINRDPYGWAALRTLGLAVGLRVYDTALGEFQLSDRLLPRIADALAIARDRYADVDIGAPFVDLLYRDGDLAQLASFDGDPPTALKRLAGDIVDQLPLAAVQLALRPLADRFRPGARAVSYWRAPAVAEGFSVEAADQVSIVEIIEADGAGAVPVLVANRPDNPLLEDRPSTRRYQLKGGQRTLLLRVVSPAQTGAAKPVCKGGEANEVDLPECLAPKGLADPFGRFAEFSPQQRAVLVNTDARAPAALAMARFDAWSRLRFPDEAASTAARDPAAVPRTYDAGFLAQVAAWSQRFLDHGPGAKAQVDRRAILFSLAALERTDPHRVAADADGVLSVLLLHDDRYDRLRRFAVQPYGRYAQIEDALRVGGPPPRELRLAALKDPRVFADVSVPRTAPLAPPVILSARRLETCASGAGQELELVVARHAEDVLSEANRVAEGALGFEHTAVGFWREYATPAWAKALGCLPDLEAAFGGGQRLEPRLSFPAAKPYGDLEDRHPDGWRGVSIYRLQGLPFFYRVHALAFAAAGVVVSPISTATFEEGGYMLRAPWAQDHPSHDPTLPPDWTVEVDPDAPRAPVIVRFRVPLVRYLDEADEAQWEAWLGHGDTDPARAAFSVPDPAVRYELHLESLAADGRRLSISREADLAAETAGEGPAYYRIRGVGPRLTATPEVGVITSAITAAGWRVWTTSAALQVRGDAVGSTAPDRFEGPPLATTVLGHAQFIVAPALFSGAWGIWAPRAQAQLRVVRPRNAADWAGFPARVAAARTALAPYLSHEPAAQQLEALLARFEGVASLAAWNAVAPGVTEYVALLPDHPAGLPGLAWDEPIRVAAGVWTWPQTPPADVLAAAGEAARQALAAGLNATGAPDVAAALTLPLLEALQGLVRAWRVARDRGVWGQGERADPLAPPVGLASVTAALTDPTLVAAAKAIEVADLPAGVDLPRTARLIASVRDPQALATLWAALEPCFGGGDALVDLARFAQAAVSMPLALRLPGRVAAAPAVKAALAVIAGAQGWTLEDPDALVLWRPPSSDERAQVAARLSAAPDLKTLFVDTADDQLFGLARRPALKILRGVAAPVTVSGLKETQA